MGEKVETGVSGGVREFHFRCLSGHEFSLMAKAAEPEAVFGCPIGGCVTDAELLGDNEAEVSNDPAGTAGEQG
jgi:hypothetical protein